MKRDQSRNTAHSTQERLKHLARREGRGYQELLIRHGLERFLYRLSATRHRRQFILKGALLLEAWTGLSGRPTRDIDLLGPLDLAPDDLKDLVGDCARLGSEEDGWQFDDQDIVVEPIRESAAYMELRAVFPARLGNSRVRMQLDVGSGDEVVPRPSRLVLPTLLDQSAPDLLCYSPYTSVAEKLDAMIVLGLANSRMKDYFDIAFLSECMQFSGRDLRDAIRGCCDRRSTAMGDGVPDGLASLFARDQQAGERWRGFVRKSGLEDHAVTWAETVARCREFLIRPLEAAQSDGEFDAHWNPGGPWNAHPKSS